MTDPDQPATVDNGRIAQAEFSFFTGSVGVRDRAEHIEAAYFGRAPNVRLPVDGTLDGQAARVIDAQSRAVNAPTRGPALRAVTLTIVLLPAGTN